MYRSPDATPAARVSLVPKNARARIVAEWHQYARKPGANRDMEMGSFYRWLESVHPELLRFRFHGSKWELVRAWLDRDERVRQAVARGAHF
jgi:hypothetical protein